MERTFRKLALGTVCKSLSLRKEQWSGNLDSDLSRSQCPHLVHQSVLVLGLKAKLSSQGSTCTSSELELCKILILSFLTNLFNF